jgi:hypothetical protein
MNLCKYWRIYGKGELVLVIDSCFSGKWVDYLKNKTKLNKRVHIQASCQATEVSEESEDGGEFTEKWIRFNQTFNSIFSLA